MNKKQLRLNQFLRQLQLPAAADNRAAADDGSIEESLPAAGLAPAASAVTPALVRGLLEQQRNQTGNVGLEESFLPIAHAGATKLPAPASLLSPPVAVLQPISDRTIEIAEAAVQKAYDDEAMDDEEVEVIEAIVLPGLRPVLDVIDGDISTPPAGWESLDADRALIKRVLPSIGRIDVPELAMVLPYAGTGFFVGDGILMTNRHVAEIFTFGVGAGPRLVRFQPGRSARFDPQYEVGDPDSGAGSDIYEVVEPLLVHPHWDMALLRVQPAGGSILPPPLLLAQHQPAVLGAGGQPDIMVIGYPAFDPRNNQAQQLNIFHQIFNRKRLMPGSMTGFDEVGTSWRAQLHAVKHDATTLGGNSGSAVIDRASGLVLALHFAGRYLESNYGIPSWELAQDRQIVELGAQFGVAERRPAEGGNGATIRISPAGRPKSEPTWNHVEPLPTAPRNAGRASTPASEQRNGRDQGGEATMLPVAPDWFERVSDADLVEAMRRDPVATERLIRETLLPDEADDLLADLSIGAAAGNGVSQEEGLFDLLTGAAKTDPTLPEIIFLHGIMGGHLAANTGLGGRVWLSPLALVAGGVARRLALAEDGERDLLPGQVLYPDGHLRLAYEKPARKWRLRGFAVHEWTFDWRKPLVNSADRLHHFIESLRLERPGKTFALVGHSMGGLVAALYAARQPQWSARVSQAIFIGSPLRGSFVPIDGILGTYPAFQKVAFADTKDELSDYVATARTLPGLIDMLPDPEVFPDAAALYQRSTWPEDRAPAQVWLDRSRQVKRLLAGSPLLQTAHLIVAPNHGTVGRVAVNNGRLTVGPRNQAGDGTVPARSAAASIDGSSVFRAGSAHGEMQRDDAVITAVEELLKNGSCALPRLTREEIEAELPVEEAVLPGLEESIHFELAPRLSTGLFTQQDADFLLRSDYATLPGVSGTRVEAEGYHEHSSASVVATALDELREQQPAIGGD